MAQNAPEETALQDWLEEAFTSQGYECYNYHKRERVNEHGVDMECVSESERVVIQAKVKPLKKDILQLRKFAKVPADRRVYAHWELPVKQFQVEIKKLPVEALMGDELRRFLTANRSLGYLRWRFLNSNSVLSVAKAVEVIYSAQGVPDRPLNKRDLEHVWRLKSTTVQLRAVIRLLKDFFVDRLQKEHTEDNVVRLTEDVFQAIQRAEPQADAYLSAIEQVRAEAPHVLSKFLLHTSGRSGWAQLDAKIRHSDNKERRAIVDDWLIEAGEALRFASAYNWLNEVLDNLEDRFGLFSEGVDWLFQSEWKGKYGTEFEAYDE